MISMTYGQFCPKSQAVIKLADSWRTRREPCDRRSEAIRTVAESARDDDQRTPDHDQRGIISAWAGEPQTRFRRISPCRDQPPCRRGNQHVSVPCQIGKGTIPRVGGEPPLPSRDARRTAAVAIRLLHPLKQRMR